MIQIALGSFLKEQELAINYLTYNSSLPTPIRLELGQTLFSKPIANLTCQQERFQLYDQYGQLFADDLLKREFERLLPTILAKELEPMMFETPYLEGVFALVESLKATNYQVVMYRQQRLASWQVLEPRLLLQELATLSELGEDPQGLVNRLEYQEQDDLATLTNQDGEAIMQEEPDTRLSHEDEPTYYAVLDEVGEVVLGKIPLELLGILLFGLVSDVSPAFLQAEFLSVEGLSDNEIAESHLLFESYRVSPPHKVESVTDLMRNGEQICVTDSQNMVEEYYFWQPPAYSRLSRGIMPKDLPVILGELAGNQRKPDYTKEKMILSEKIVDLAASQDLTLFRVDRLLTAISDTDDLEYTNGKISDFTIERRQQTTSNKLETLFEARCLHTGEVLFPDLTLANLVSKLMAYSLSE